MHDGKRKRNIPNGGFLAGYHRPCKVESAELEPTMNFILFSDGVSDTELSERYILSKSVNEVTATYAYKNGQSKDDDTTLIAMRYTG